MFKSFIKISVILGLLVSFISCKKEARADSYETYTTQSIEWSDPIDLAGVNNSSTNIYQQMQLTKWWGLQSVSRKGSDCSPFYQNKISQIDSERMEVQLFLPFPRCSPERDREVAKRGVCDVYLDEYSILCEMEEDGSIRIIRTSDNEDYFKNPKLTLKNRFDKDGEMYFEADTFYYDWKSDEIKDGHVKMRFLKNAKVYIERYIRN